MDAVGTLLARATVTLRRRRALAWAARAGVFAFGVLVIEGVVARFTPLPTTPSMRLVVMAAPVAAAIAGWLRPSTDREVRAEAGRWVGEPALLLAMDVGASELSPLVVENAVRKASNAEVPPTPVGSWTRAAALLLIPAAIAAFAPGHATEPLRLGNEQVSQIRTTGRALIAEGLPDSVSRDHKAAVKKALRNLDKAGVTESEVKAAVAELKAAIKDAGGTWDALTNAAHQAPLLEPTWQALDRGDTEAALQAIRDLAARIAAGELKTSDLKTTANALLAAVGGASEADRGLLKAAGDAMAAGDGSGLEAALAELLPRTGPPDAKTRGVEKAIVALEGAVGRPGADPGEQPGATDASPLASRGTTAQAAIDAFGEGRLAPEQREILRNYFAHR